MVSAASRAACAVAALVALADVRSTSFLMPVDLRERRGCLGSAKLCLPKRTLPPSRHISGLMGHGLSPNSKEVRL